MTPEPEAAVAIAAPSPDDRDEFIAAVWASKQVLLPWVDAADSPERFAAYLDRFPTD